MAFTSLAEASWTALDRYNRNVEEHLRTLMRLSEQDSEAYKVALRAASARRLMGGKAASDEVSRTMQQLSDSLQVSSWYTVLALAFIDLRIQSTSGRQ